MRGPGRGFLATTATIAVIAAVPNYQVRREALGFVFGQPMAQSVVACLKMMLLRHSFLEGWTPPLEPLCLYYSNRRNSSAAFQAFIALARDFAAGRLAPPLA